MTRNYSFDVLRILSAVMVVVLHYCEIDMFGAFDLVECNSLSDFFLRFIYSCSRPAVDIFIMLSGFFSIHSDNKKLGKIISLFVKTVFFSELSYIILVYCDVEVFMLKRIFIYFLPQNYYLFLYSTIYLLSPYLNRVVVGLSKEQYGRFVCILSLLFVVWSTSINSFTTMTSTSFIGVYTVGIWGTQMGFNIANFVTLYYIGGYLAVHVSLHNAYSARIMSLVCFFTITIIEAIVYMKFSDMGKTFLQYDSILIVMQSVCIMLFFKTLNVKRFKIIDVLAQRSYGVFLIHFMFFSLIDSYYSNYKLLISNSVYSCISITFAIVALVYLLSSVFDLLVNRITKPLDSWWSNHYIANARVLKI